MADYKIRIFFGSPGCGKSTFAVMRMLTAKQQGFTVYSNFDNQVSDFTVTCDKLGEWSPRDDSFLVVDEAGIDFNSRKTLSLPQSTIRYFKYHRHQRNSIDYYSQAYDDIDITVRRLAHEYWYIKKIGPFSLARRVDKFVSVNDTTHQIEDGFKLCSMIRCILPPPFHDKTCMLCFRPKYYNYFNSFSRLPLPDWDIFNADKQKT